jgi:hypothetical protein
MNEREEENKKRKESLRTDSSESQQLYRIRLWGPTEGLLGALWKGYAITVGGIPHGPIVYL